MRNINGGDAEILLHLLQLIAELHTQFGIQIGKRLVHADNRRTGHQRAGYRNTLLLAAGKLGDSFLKLFIREIHLFSNIADLFIDFRFFQFFQFQAESDVVIDRHRREKGIALENNTDIPVLNGNMGNILILYDNRAGNRFNETCDRAQRCRLPAARWAQKCKKLPFFDMNINIMQGCKISEFNYYVIEFDHILLHFLSLPKQRVGFPTRRIKAFSD